MNYIKMRLLILTQQVNKNGDLLGFFHDWIREFANQNEKVTVICLEKRDFDLPENVRVLSLGKEEGASFIVRIFNFYKHIWRERNSYDKVFVHMNPEYVILGGLFWRLLGKEVALWYAHKAVHLKLWLAEKMTNIIFTASTDSFRLRSRKIKIIGHGIDTDKFKKQSEEENESFEIVTIGRISPVKKYEVLLEAIDIIRNEYKINNIKVSIIGGPGTEEQESYFLKLKKISKERGVDDIVSFFGSVPNMEIKDYLDKSDLFVHMSNTGSLDKAILEAMSAELLVLSSNDSSRELLSSYRDDLLFNIGDSQQLAEKIISLKKKSVEEKEVIGRGLRKIVVDNHGLKNLINKIRDTYGKAS